MEYNSAIKRKEIFIYVHVMEGSLSERTLTKKNSIYCILFIENSRKCKLICSDRKQISGSLGMRTEGERKERWVAEDSKETFKVMICA